MSKANFESGRAATAPVADEAVTVQSSNVNAFLLGMTALMSNSVTGEPAQQSAPYLIASGSHTESPVSASKLMLIRRFLRAIGRQDQLDSGSFLERYAMPGGVMWSIGSQPSETLLGGFERRMAALKKVYENHRATYQRAYEDHVNWEFTEQELTKIVEFLESPVGNHYLDGRWRMEAYTNTNTEDLEQKIVAEAQASLAK